MFSRCSYKVYHSSMKIFQRASTGKQKHLLWCTATRGALAYVNSAIIRFSIYLRFPDHFTSLSDCPSILGSLRAFLYPPVTATQFHKNGISQAVHSLAYSTYSHPLHMYQTHLLRTLLALRRGNHRDTCSRRSVQTLYPVHSMQ